MTIFCIILCVILFIVGVVLSIWLEDGLPLMAVMVFAMIALMLITATTYNEEDIDPKLYVTELYALKDNMDTNGTFFLGCGSVDNNLRYYYMYKYKDGYKVGDISTYSVYIVEDNNQIPAIIKSVPQSRIVYNKFGALFFKDRIHTHKLDSETKIIIPEGSLYNNYDVDLE